MDEEQAELVRVSFATLIRRRADAGRIFYDRLFQIAPELRPMFGRDINRQADKFMDTLSLSTGLLRHEHLLTRTLTGLGQRHRAYGVQPDHYALVGDALMWTIGQILGSACTPKVQEAWSELYGKAATIMTGQDRLEAA